MHMHRDTVDPQYQCICIYMYGYHRLPIEALLIALDAHKFSHNGYGPVTKDQVPKAAGPRPSNRQAMSNQYAIK